MHWLTTEHTPMAAHLHAHRGLALADGDLRAVVDQAPLAIIVVDLEDRVQLWNRAAERLFGWAEQEVLGRHLPIIPLEAHTEDQNVDGRVLAGEEPRGFEAKCRRKDGTLIEAHISVSALHGADGKAVGVMRFIVEIGERKRLEQQLRQAQKMEALGRLVGGVAHDFNNLLTAILVYSGLLQSQLSPESRLQRHVEDIRIAGERGAELVAQLLALGRKQVMEPVMLSLNSALSEMTEMLQRLLGEDIELVTSFALRLGQVRVDPAQLQQVVLNLALNARDAMPSGGRLVLETANAEADEKGVVHYPGLRPGRYVTFTVSDTGVGMDPETRARVFEPFFTTKPSGRGSGLGLSTVYGIVKQSGGYVYVSSEPGRGTAVQVFLPRLEWQGEAVGAAVAHEPQPNVTTVLLVEDEEIVRRSLHQALSDAGFRVLQAGGAREALAASEHYPGSIDMVVTDVVMPGMSGRELAERLAEVRPGVPVLFISGYTQDARLVGKPFVRKPFAPAKLLEKMQELLPASRPS
jgi:PAS domain S-box-containing protein